MKTSRLTDLPIKHLEYVFSPPGLPLPVKGETDIGTTSILVRGGAGSGKTTFALALAHAIAKAGGGLVLFLATEFSPVEIAFKATLVGLPENIVGVWPGEADAKPGGVVVEHLTALRDGNPVLSSAERRRSSIDAVWGRLHPEKEHEKVPAQPVRAVVIDALTLPEPGEGEGAQRADLVAFVQALENDGISVVLVEELGQGAAAWSAFVVDVVFELAFVPDVETHELRRKLTLSKCRYAVSIPGPHDYGLEAGTPGVWPDLSRVTSDARAMTALRDLAVAPPPMLLPIDIEDNWAQLGSSVILSPYDKTSVRAPRVLDRTSGMLAMRLSCGAVTVIGHGRDAMHAYDYEGPHAISWSFLVVAKKMGVNACVVNNVEALLLRPNWATAISHVLEGVRAMGFVVCVHSPWRAIKSLFPMADYVWGNRKYSPVRLRGARHKRLAAKSLVAPWARAVGDASGSAVAVYSYDDPVFAALQAEAKVLEGALKAEDLFVAVKSDLKGGNVDKRRLVNLALAEGGLGHLAAWFAFHIGFDWCAARAAIAAVESDEPAPAMLLLWKSVCAGVAKNRAAISDLEGLLASPAEPLILSPLLRGLAGTGQLDDADRIIDDVGARYTLAPWMLDRMRADTRLDSGNADALRDAAGRLEKLVKNASLPPVHCAETLHNLGTARDRLGEREAAITAFEQATALNPNLDAAREELDRLRPPPKPASS